MSSDMSSLTLTPVNRYPLRSGGECVGFQATSATSALNFEIKPDGSPTDPTVPRIIGLNNVLEQTIGIPTLRNRAIKQIHLYDIQEEPTRDQAYDLHTTFKYRIEYKKKDALSLKQCGHTALKAMKIAVAILISPLTILAGIAYSAKYAIESRYCPDSMPSHIRKLQWEIERAAANSLIAACSLSEIPFAYAFVCESPEFKDLATSCTGLRELAKIDDPKNIAALKTAYNQCIQNLRKALNHEAYQRHKTEADNPYVKFLHRFCVAIWHHEQTDTQAYKAFGQKVLELHQPQANENTLSADFVKNHRLYKHYWVRESINSTIMWAITHIRAAVGTQASLGGWRESFAEKFKFLGFGAYDPMGSLSNHPVLHFETNENNVTKRHMYGPTPTSHGEINPEFVGLLDAIRLQQAARRNNQSYLPNTPDALLYFNYQNINAKGARGEGDRSRALMNLLKTDYKGIAAGITLSQDSPLFMMKDQDSLSMWQSPQVFESRMRAHLLDEASYSYENRQEAAHQAQGCFFPGERNDWEPIHDAILKKVTEHFSQKTAPQTAEQAKEYCVAYQMLVYQLLQSLNEENAILFLKKRRIANPVLHIQAPCKEHVDRGGVNDALKGHLNNRPLDETTGFLFGRPLAACNRMIMKHRLDPLNLTKHIDHTTYSTLRDELVNAISHLL